MEFKVGLFVSVGAGLVMLAVLILGGSDSIFSRHVTYVTHFPQIEGLLPGSKVVFAGLNIGTVDSVEFDEKAKDIAVTVKVLHKYAEWVRKDTFAEIATQGML